MTRRQVIGVVAAVAVVAANVAVWYMRSNAGGSTGDPRDAYRGALAREWRGLEATPIDDARPALVEWFDRVAPLEEGAARPVDGVAFSLDTLPTKARDDLRDALAGAVEAIASADAATLTAYMQARGMEFDPRKLKEFQKYATKGAEVGGGPAERYAAVHAALEIDPHWESVVAGATQLHVWRPASLRHISMIQLGRDESWLWGNEVVFGSAFLSKPSFEVASAKRPALVADARVVIEHDHDHGKQRSPYFFRFWYEESQKQWRPMALKFVRTEDPERLGPPLLF